MPTVANELINNLNQAILAQDIPAMLIFLEQCDDKSINDYDLKDLLVKKRPIDCAIATLNPLIVQLVCGKKPVLDEHCESTGRTPVQTVITAEWSADNRQDIEKILEMLYLAGANFRAKEKITGYSLIHLALLHGKAALIPDLVKLCSCDINAVDENRATPLKLAIDRFGDNSDITNMIYDLGGKLHSNATQELYDRINAQHDVYHQRYARRYHITFRERQPEPNTFKAETDEEFCRLGKAKPLAGQSMFEKQGPNEISEAAFISLVDSHVKMIVNGAKDSLYQVFYNKLARHELKQELVEAILAECATRAESAKNKELYQLRVDGLTKMLVVVDETEKLASSGSAISLK